MQVYFYRVLLLSFLFFCCITPATLLARHIIGGEITYRYLSTAANGDNRYEFTMKIYRDCFGGGAGFDNPAQMAIYRGSYTNNIRVADFQVFSPDITRLIPVPPPCVTQLPNVCVEEGIYVFERTLPVLLNESYFIVYQRCCRNQTIKNIVAPGDIGATYMIELTAAAQQLKNSSPTFNNFPPIIICANIPLTFDHSATDAEGDQIFYSFCSPLEGGGPLLNPPGLYSCNGAVPTPPCGPPFNNVPFVVPAFAPDNPMGGSPQVTINSQSGLITGTPNSLGQFVVGVCIQEFRGATLLSTVRRDFQFNVAECTPTVLANIQSDSIVGPKRFVLNSCGNNTITFQNQSLQQSNISNFEWRFNLKTSTFVDNTNWNATVTFPDTGTYLGVLYLNPGLPCADTANIRVNVFPKIDADFEFSYDTCVAGPVSFTDLSTGEGGINRWSWNFGVPNGTSSQQNPDFLYPIPGNHPVNLRVFDQNNCTDNITKVVNWFPVPPLIILQPNRYIGCTPAEIFFNNLSTPIDSTYDITWDFGDGKTTEGVISPTHIYEETGVYTVQVAITSPIGCFTADTFVNLIRVEPSPVANFTYFPDSLLTQFNNTIQFTDLSVGANRWNWQFDEYGTTTKQNPTFTFPDTGLMQVTLIVTHPQGCKDSLTRYLDFSPEIRWFMPNAFTPNGDGQNDGFRGKGYLDGVVNFNMTIWNRWGELVFETANPEEEWNGRKLNTGGMSPDGVYVYLVTFTAPRGEKQEFKGYATLIR
ncbi:MAG: gliding motility-associated C-terminal domain-containing protein [Lewinellaceae bacterium]|nr:gliding motility-associated C-terminal domain-containing protein [Lewinellaceae bacterium]